MKYLAILTSVFFLVGCANSKNTTPEKKPLNQPITGALEKIEKGSKTHKDSDAYGITNATIKGDSLFADISYSGGCGEASFNLYWNGAMMKSMPPQVNLWFHLDDKDDCEALVKKKMAFDISALLESNNEVVVRLHNFETRLTITK